jgi:hypothetical protein
VEQGEKLGTVTLITAKKTQRVSSTKIIVQCCFGVSRCYFWELFETRKYTPRESAEVLIVKSGVTYSYHWDL